MTKTGYVGASLLLLCLIALVVNSVRFEKQLRHLRVSVNELKPKSVPPEVKRCLNQKEFDYHFFEPDFASILDATLSFDRGIDDHLTVSCLNKNGIEIARVFSFDYWKYPYADYGDYYLMDIPRLCFVSPDVHVRIASRHLSCLEPGRVSLHLLFEHENRTVKNLNPIEGYSNKVSYAPGETLELKVHSLEPNYKVTIRRHGAKEQVVFKRDNLAGVAQNYKLYSSIFGCNWKTSITIPVSKDWPPGIYSVLLSTQGGKKFGVSFVVKGMGHNPILVLASTNTWQAYNPWGKASFYKYSIKDRMRRKISNVITTQRPNPEAQPDANPLLARGEIFLLQWLEQNGYSYDLISDEDLDVFPTALKGYQTLIVSTHPEYWTENMYKITDKFLDRGGNLAYLGGNGAFYRVLRLGDRLEARKDGSVHTSIGKQGGIWPNVGRFPASLFGIEYDPSSYGSLAPYEVLKPTHWIFEGTNVKTGDLIGAKTAIPQEHDGASGIEVDRATLMSPPNLEILAEGINPSNIDSGKKAGAHMTYYDHPGGGGVFSVGSLTFTRAVAIDPVLGQLLKNVLEKFRTNR